ncbi:hypothetical protein JW813_05225 [Clostridium botulinum]|uniref:ParM/StbA family protein n=1 Tax=Clostridium botulinum TaxID=1491 RepID=UPI002247BE23|nr:hypothetical protein [Clostridium botulinum]UZP04410.1 hypothetical protein JW813_05225 [Clostridium botulinum]UZP07822.1 hypothetical protein JYA71_05500 [Clostridium botulinum]UZP11149.1 hypothetical protein JYA74_05220 [Clostridium botulinum]
MKIFKKLINRFKNKFKSNKSNTDVTGKKGKLFVDLGASSIKIAYENKFITFRSSVRKVIDMNEITIQRNALKVNGNWFIIGESKVQTGNYKLKCDKPNLDVLICYGIELLSQEIEITDNLEVTLLLPYNQIFTKSQFQKKLNNDFVINDKNYKLTLGNIAVEGESSKVYVDEKYMTTGNLIVCNIGYSTIDNCLYNSMGNREIISSINIGTNNLLSNYLRHTDAPTSSILNSWLCDNYVINSNQEQIKEANKEYIELIWNDLYNSIVKLSNPQNTTIVFCGGGSNLLINEFKEVIPSDYNVITLGNMENVFSDLFGSMVQNNNNSCLIELEVEVPKSNYEKCIELLEKNYSLNDIAEKLGLCYGTVKNYSSRYKNDAA